MVGEFADLQGIMGGYYAANEGLDADVAAAIRDHYKPVGQGDEVPTAPVTVAVSLADKLDSILAFFAIDEAPTGSKDPFALRRSAIGILGLLERNRLRMKISAVLHRHLQILFWSHYWAMAWDEEVCSTRQLGKKPRSPDSEDFRNAYACPLERNVFPESSEGVLELLDAFHEESEMSPIGSASYIVEAFGRNALAEVPDLLAFFADRLKVQQREAGVRHDLIDAVFALGGEDDLVRLLARVKALQAFLKTADGANLLAGHKRAANILKKEEWAPVEGDYSPEPEEALLREALERAEPEAEAAIAREDFEGAMAALATLRKPIDAFFDTVTVNDEDPAKRAARLDMLARFRDAVHRVADFSKIEG
jgi:glycyl-tRNA synthetase beta chain